MRRAELMGVSGGGGGGGGGGMRRAELMGVSGDGGVEVVMAVEMVMPATLQGVAGLDRDWEGPGPRFVQITARYQNRCGGCGGDAPVGTRITYDRLQRQPHPP